MTTTRSNGLRVVSSWALPIVLIVLVGAAAAVGSAAQTLGKPVVKIGVAAALKMPFGKAFLRSAEMAAKEINDAGGLDKGKVPEALKKVRLPESEAWGAKEFRFNEAHRVHISQQDGMLFYSYQYAPESKIKILAPAEYATGQLTIPSRLVEAWKK